MKAAESSINERIERLSLEIISKRSVPEEEEKKEEEMLDHNTEAAA